MELYGWKYEGRKISDELHSQILVIIGIINDPQLVDNRTWGGSLQKYIGSMLGVAAGQVRTIKRMMEEFDILKKGALNSREVPTESTIYTDNGRTLVELLSTEKLMSEQKSYKNLEHISEIKKIYQLYYQKVMVNYAYFNSEDGVLHPLKATLKAIKKYGYLDYWEWYILNTVISCDDNPNEEKELELAISKYRTEKIKFVESDIKGNSLSHSYVLGNFVYPGFVRIEGKREKMKIYINESACEIVNNILEK